MIGVNIRLSMLCNDKKNAVIAALDAGGFFGPYAGLIDLAESCRLVSEADAILIEPGYINMLSSIFTKNNAPLIITRLNWNSDYCFQWNYNKSSIVKTLSPQTALAKGATLGIASLSINTGNEDVDARNIKVFTEIIEEAEKVGLPIIGEVYPPAKNYQNEEFFDLIYRTSRICAELGASAIKTFYTGDNFRKIIDSVKIPVLALGGDKKEKDIFSLMQAENSIKDGAKGLVFGRNLYQSENPQNYLKALKDIAARKLSARQAAEKYGLSI